MKKLILPFLTLVFVASCAESQKPSYAHLGPLKSRMCFEFSKTESRRQEVTAVIHEIQNRFGGIILDEPHMVYFGIEPDYYLDYTDRMRKFGNLVISYWEGEVSEIDQFMEAELRKRFDVIDCSGSYFSSTSRYRLK